MTRMLTDLADACRTSGLEVIEVDGWRTRTAAPNGGRFGGPGMDAVRGLLIHHTATPETYQPDRDYPTYAVILRGNGSTGGPLSQLGLCRCGKHVYVFAAGICWHAGTVRDYNTQGNRVAIGIEAEHSGLRGDMPWPKARYDGYVRLAAAIARWYKIPTRHVVGHKEASTSGKIDPLFDMDAFRRAVDVARNRDTSEPDPLDGYTEKHWRWVQRSLADAGYLADTPDAPAVDGIPGPLTRTALRSYQADHDLDPDALPGPLTTRSLEATMTTIGDLATKIDGIVRDHLTVRYSESTRLLIASGRSELTLAQAVAHQARRLGQVWSWRPGVEEQLAAIRTRLDAIQAVTPGVDQEQVDAAVRQAVESTRIRLAVEADDEQEGQ